MEGDEVQSEPRPGTSNDEPQPRPRNYFRRMPYSRNPQTDRNGKLKFPVGNGRTWENIHGRNYPITAENINFTRWTRGLGETLEQTMIDKLLRNYYVKKELPLREKWTGVRIYPNDRWPNTISVKLSNSISCSQFCWFPTPATSNFALHILETDICRRHVPSLTKFSWVYLNDNIAAGIIKLFTDRKLATFIRDIRKMLIHPDIDHKLIGCKLTCSGGRATLMVRIQLIVNQCYTTRCETWNLDITDPIEWHPKIHEYMDKFYAFMENTIDDLKED